jgi:hypothetical protein
MQRVQIVEISNPRPLRSHDEIVEVTLVVALGAPTAQALLGSGFKNFAGIGIFVKRSAT